MRFTHWAALPVFAAALMAQLPDFTPPSPLLGAVLRGDAEGTRKALAEGADANKERFFGFPALTIAVMQANRETTRVLLDGGAAIQIQDANGNTPLMWAVGQETPQPALLEDLLARGADARAANHFGDTALTWAMKRGQMDAVKRLKEAGASDRPMIRQAVERAMVPLQKSGPQFVKVSGCVSCHHQSLPQMVYGAARQRGWAMDAALAEQQVKAVMAMFKPVREKLMDGSMMPPNPSISVGYALLGLEAEGYAPDETTKAMVAAIARTQLPDGSFALLGVRPPMESSGFTGAALAVRALRTYGDATHEPAVARAREWMMRTRPATNEDKTMRLLGLAWSRAPKGVVESAAADLLADQRVDGGWAQLADLETDAYATGQAMAALRLAGVAAGAAYERGTAYLLRTQLADGTWLVRTRANAVQPLKESGFPHGRDQWISAAGTSWAAWALALSEPVADETSSEE